MAKQLKTATKIKDILRYAGEVSIYELSKPLKKTINHVVIARCKPFSGMKWITVWESDEKGTTIPKPIAEYGNISIADALKELGYILK
jgi:hypothetical protein